MARMWFLQNKTTFMRSPEIRDCLKRMGITITGDSTNRTMLDLTEYFKDDFRLPRQRYVLSFLAHCDLDQYPEAVSQLVKEYLRAIAEGQPDKAMICHLNDMIVVG